MNYEIFIEFDNSNILELSEQLYNLFLENNYSVTFLDNNIPFNEKIKIIKDSNKKNIIISNKINNDNNTIEIVYSLRDTDSFAKTINNQLINNFSVSKYYQLRSGTNTNLDYYEILRDIKNNESIIIKYGNNLLNNTSLANNIYRGITNYLNEQNVYTVQSGDSLYSIARRFNTTVDEIKKINNLTSNNLSIGQKLFIPDTIPDNPENNNNSNSSNNIYIVQSGDSLYSIARRFNTTVDEIKRINNLTSNNLSIGQKLFIPDIIPDNQENNNDKNNNNNTYTVQSGDSLYSIARRFNTTVDEIKKINNLTSNNLSIGQKLFIPDIIPDNQENNNDKNNIYTVQSRDSLYNIARRFNTTVDEIKRLNNLTSNNLSIGQKLIISSSNSQPSTISYIVQSGDSLYGIARRFNTTVDEIKRINNLTSNNLSIEQKLFLPN